MVNLAHYAEIKALLDEVTAVADRLSPNERELFHTLTARYEEPVTLRKGYGMKASEATRRLDLPRKSDETED
jgi:DNA-directed RNA polymerase specialized sigma24 family protein